MENEHNKLGSYSEDISGIWTFRREILSARSNLNKSATKEQHCYLYPLDQASGATARRLWANPRTNRFFLATFAPVVPAWPAVRVSLRVERADHHEVGVTCKRESCRPPFQLVFFGFLVPLAADPFSSAAGILLLRTMIGRDLEPPRTRHPDDTGPLKYSRGFSPGTERLDTDLRELKLGASTPPCRDQQWWRGTAHIMKLRGRLAAPHCHSGMRDDNVIPCPRDFPEFLCGI